MTESQLLDSFDTLDQQVVDDNTFRRLISGLIGVGFDPFPRNIILPDPPKLDHILVLGSFPLFNRPNLAQGA
ncbi:MAG: hypothetical protein CEN92_230 [Candidatus Berkelbacteria bacterium Licking1014_96]|uniref:Uncharacterized protein n=1 Tax=Candidatus Berkelbacteria bacterium Licking1014_96 TaxID=2017149 RepID=A0A554LFL5_9BACT|nr:MAG: hypothetical protein CEN92_230 [Candidatus Berkelbacteria bacterium Licking1014_96]